MDDKNIYRLDNNKNKSRSSKIFNKIENEIDHDKQLSQSGLEQNYEQDLQFIAEESANNQKDSVKPREFRKNIGPTQVNQALQAVINNLKFEVILKKIPDMVLKKQGNRFLNFMTNKERWYP